MLTKQALGLLEVTNKEANGQRSLVATSAKNRPRSESKSTGEIVPARTLPANAETISRAESLETNSVCAGSFQDGRLRQSSPRDGSALRERSCQERNQALHPVFSFADDVPGHGPRNLGKGSADVLQGDAVIGLRLAVADEFRIQFILPSAGAVIYGDGYEFVLLKRQGFQRPKDPIFKNRLQSPGHDVFLRSNDTS